MSAARPIRSCRGNLLTLLLLSLIGIRPTQAGDDVVLWRTAFSAGSAVALTGRRIRLPDSTNTTVRVWVGLTKASDHTDRLEQIQRRHQEQLTRLQDQWMRDPVCSPQERRARLRHIRNVTPVWFDVVVIETRELGFSGCYVDWNLDGACGNDESSAAVNLGILSWHDLARAPCLTFRRNPDTIGLGPLPGLPTTATSTDDSAGNLPHASREQQAETELLSRLRQLDHPAIRKQHLTEIIEIADRLLQKKQTLTTELRADVLYRQGRALGYQTLPDVVAKQPLADPQAHQRQFEHTYQQLQQLVDTTQPRYVLLAVRRERRRGCRGRALDLLELYQQRHPRPDWYQKKRRDLLRELEVTLPAHQAAAELWMTGKKPARRVPVTLRYVGQHTGSRRPVVSGSWLKNRPWCEPTVELQPVAEDVWEQVVWLQPGRSYRLQLSGQPDRTLRVDQQLMSSGLTVRLGQGE